MPPTIDSFTIYENNEKINEIIFEYPVHGYMLRSRLFLLGIKEKEKNGNLLDLYKFDYNIGYNNLPGYFSGQTDHYGFYNERTSFPTFDLLDISDSFKNKDVQWIDSLINENKKPDEFCSQAALLTKIVYPTGGYSNFIYEGHRYGRKFKTWPFTTEENENNETLLTGGSRIKKIENYDNSGEKLSEKLYHYVKDYKEGGEVSSGVLAYTPTYLDYFFNKYYFVNKKLYAYWRYDFLRIASNSIYPLTSYGPHITYSEVTVEEPGNGFTTYKYRNYDNGYGDRQPQCYGSTKMSSSQNYNHDYGVEEFWKNDPGISMELERGLLTSLVTYDNFGNAKKKIEYTYNDSEDRFKKGNVRYLRYEPNSFQLIGKKCYRLSTGVIYTYFPYLKEKTETTYFGSGNDVKEVVQKEQFTYDEDYRLVKSIRAFNNSNEEYLTEYQYTLDQDTTVSLIQNMMDRSMFANLFEKKVTVPSGQSMKEMYEYRDDFNVDSVPLLYKTKTQFPDNSVRVNSIIPRYDLLGNPAEINHYTDENLCVIWGYKGQYPVARVKNATYNQILSILGENTIEEILNSSTLSDSHIAALNNLRSNPLLQDAYISTYSYIPGVGMDSETNPMGITTHYLYDGFGRLTSVTDDDGNRLEGYDYHYKQ